MHALSSRIRRLTNTCACHGFSTKAIEGDAGLFGIRFSAISASPVRWSMQLRFWPVTKRIIWLASAWQAVFRIWVGVIVYHCCFWRLRDQLGNVHLHTYTGAKHSHSIWHLPYNRSFLISAAIRIHRLGQYQTSYPFSIAVLLAMANNGQPGLWLLERPWHGQPYSGVDLGLKSML